MRAWSQAIFYFDQLRFWDKVNVKRGEFLTLNVNLNESWCWQESRYYTCGSPTYLSQLIFNADVHFFRCFSSPAKHPLSKSTTLQPMVLLRLHFQMMKIVMLCISMRNWVSVEKEKKNYRMRTTTFPSTYVLLPHARLPRTRENKCARSTCVFPSSHALPLKHACCWREEASFLHIFIRSCRQKTEGGAATV